MPISALERKLHESNEFVCCVNECVPGAGDSIWPVMLNTRLGREWLNEREDFKSRLQHRRAKRSLPEENPHPEADSL